MFYFPLVPTGSGHNAEHMMEQDADVLDAAWLRQSALCSVVDIAEKLRAA